MSVEAPTRLASTRPGPRRVLAAGCLLLLAVCLWVMARDVRWRRTAAALASDQGLARRQPALVETLGVLEDGGDAATIVAEGLLDEWAATPGSPADEAGGRVQGLLLEAAVRRPGSAQARLLLGRSAPAAGGSRLWATPLELAATAAPGLEAPSVTLAQRYLSAWRNLSAEEKTRGEATLAQSLRSPGFVEGNLVAIVDALGADGAVALLPDDAASLRSAVQVLRNAENTRARSLVSARLQALRAGPPPPSQRP